MRSSALTRGIVALTATAASAALLTAGLSGSATAATAPPYEATSNAIGTITFYDSTGKVITSGSTTGPFAAYAAGTAASASGDTMAGLAFADPNPKAKPYDFYTHVLGAFSSYPATGAPAAISGLSTPVYTVGANDLTLNDFQTDSTAYTGTGYTDMVQVRMYTTDASGSVNRLSYDDADLLISGSTWTEVYPSGGGGTTPTPDATSVSIGGPSSVKAGGSAKITGTLKDTATKKAVAGQSVSLYERANSKASAKLVKTVKTNASGAVSTSVKLKGAEQFQWRYKSTSAYKASTSSYKTVSVTTSVALSVDHKTVKHGKSAIFYGHTTPTTSGIHITLQQLEGKKWKNIGSAVQKKQKLPNKKTSVAFRISHKFGKKGTYKLRVSKPATASLKGSVSKTITEHVK
ncbi:hypothetical protein [Jatrophihabitans endophyticus]|uniref:hypothetical protein n=1 Tax=Jatrophihabitans endophyticus TaxID=1206085 RepID=UPI0019D8DE53|nr:hypothetical protein [Jatrophihabitans endophyticus]MBE7188294.1 hypothetical protein [Jatrophihabitans endophyticus]